MDDTSNNVIDARLSEALGQYFNGVTLSKAVGDCSILTGVRKQNGAPVDIYTPSFAISRDDAAVTQMGKDFATYEKLGEANLQATERLLTTRAFRKNPALAVLSCPVPVFDEAFDTRPVDAKLQVFDAVLEGLAALHSKELVHGNIGPDSIRRETAESGLRLCDLTFSSDRATTVSTVSTAYQSRQVINNAQPSAVDDVHAAGMLGYRILMGPDGPARALGLGSDMADDTASLAAAILGDGAQAPDASLLFPEGHPSGDQIARLLARMTGQLPSAGPYSSAVAARKAYRTLIDTPNIDVARPMAEATAPPIAQAARQVPANPEGISKATTLMIFGGFLISTAAAAYFYMDAKGANTALANLANKATIMSSELDQSNAELAAFSATLDPIRSAERAVSEARHTGAADASQAAATQVAAANEAMRRIDELVSEGGYSDAAIAANEASTAAQDALRLVQEAQALTQDAQASANDARGAATVAAGRNADLLGEALALFDAADTATDAGRYEEAHDLWSRAADQLNATRDALLDQATTAQSAEDAASAAVAPGSTSAILGNTYASRGDAAFEDGRYSEATALFEAAIEAYNASELASSSSAVNSAQTREVRNVLYGDDEAKLAAAIELCKNEAPIAPASCPSARPGEESERSAQLLPFALGQTEVSNAEFANFVNATGYTTIAERDGRVVALTSNGEARLIDGGYTWATPRGESSSHLSAPDNPVLNIALEDAQAFCEWAGGRLPLEAEWEAAARGGDDRAFPWGTWSADQPVWRGATQSARRVAQAVSSAGGPNDSGHIGLSGNAREWVLGEDGPVLKGGSWNTANPADLRISARLIVAGNAPGVDFGFRCARDLEAWQ